MVLAALSVPVGCGSGGDATKISAAIPAGDPPTVDLRGDWPAPTTTTTTPIDPATGLSISGPIGPPWPKAFVAADAKVGSVDLYQSPGVRVPTGLSLPTRAAPRNGV